MSGDEAYVMVAERTGGKDESTQPVAGGAFGRSQPAEGERWEGKGADSLVDTRTDRSDALLGQPALRQVDRPEGTHLRQDEAQLAEAFLVVQHVFGEVDRADDRDRRVLDGRGK